MADVVIHIDRLVVRSSSGRRLHAAQLRAALEAELARLWQTGQLGSAWASGGAVPSLPSLEMTVRKPLNSKSIGEAVGGALYRSFGQ